MKLPPKNLLFGLLLFSVCHSFAQKVKKDGLGYFNYVQPRSSTLLDEVLNYKINVETQSDNTYRRELIEKEFSINGFSKIEDRNRAGFMISIEETPFKFGLSKKQTISGGENGQTSYFYKGKIDYLYKLKVLDIEGKEVYIDVLRGDSKTVGRSSTSIKDAHQNYIKDKHQFKENCAKEAAQKLSKSFNDHFTDIEKTVHLRVVNIKEKKYEYPGFHKAYNDLKAMYTILNVDNTKTEQSTKLKDNCIAFWTDFVKGATPDDKKSRINAEVTAAAYYDLGLVYFFDGNFKEATLNFEKAASYDKTVVAGIMNWIHISQKCTDRLENH